MTPQTSVWAAEALSSIDPGRVRGRLAVGLRDAALLALLARGLTCAEVAPLLCDQVTIVERTGQARITTRRPPWRCELVLDPIQSAHLVAWLSEIRGYSERRPLFSTTERTAHPRRSQRHPPRLPPPAPEGRLMSDPWQLSPSPGGEGREMGEGARG